MVGRSARRQQLPATAVCDLETVVESLERYHQALMRELRLRLRDPRLRQVLQRGQLKPFFVNPRTPIKVAPAAS
jgi:hypothetical protein